MLLHFQIKMLPCQSVGFPCNTNVEGPATGANDADPGRADGAGGVRAPRRPRHPPRASVKVGDSPDEGGGGFSCPFLLGLLILVPPGNPSLSL